jgi:hypothetical protein
MTCSSSVRIPPMPDPATTPQRSGSAPRGASAVAASMASAAAATPNSAALSVRRTSLGPT